MTRTVGGDRPPLLATPQRMRGLADRTRIRGWLHRLRDRLHLTEYVDWSDLPAEPESPYRARVSPPKDQTPDDVELGRRDVVQGSMKVVYEIRCACGKRWFNPHLENIQLCPRCDRAVLLRDPD